MSDNGLGLLTETEPVKEVTSYFNAVRAQLSDLHAQLKEANDKIDDLESLMTTAYYMVIRAEQARAIRITPFEKVRIQQIQQLLEIKNGTQQTR